MDDPPAPWRPPPVWRALLWLCRFLVAGLCRLQVTGDVPADRRRGPLLLAANHIGSFDPVVLAAACARRRIAPRILATGGLFRAPLFGTLMRRSGHVRVDRRQPTVIDALDVARVALDSRAVLLAYPEGRITLDPGMWPERGKTGLARLALATQTPVVPVAQWGAHLVLPWGAPRGSLRRVGWSVLHRPVVRVHFGPPVDLSDLATGDGPAGLPSARAVREATDRIIEAIAVALSPLRSDEPRLPAWEDPQRPVSTARTYRRRVGVPDAAR
jgi:1-acyl-sn-glycerol-3-phosphate acyltransferase